MDVIYLLVDGENIDATLGVNILKRFPRAEERPRWDRVLKYDPWAEEHQEKNRPGEKEETAPGDEHPHGEHPADGQPPAEEAKPEGQSAPAFRAEEPAGEKAEETTHTGLFFINSSQRTANTFVQALLAIGWTPILLTSENPELKIVDLGIQRTLEAIVKERPRAKVILASHDVDYLEQITDLLDAGHEAAILCFREYLAMPLAELENRGLKIIDLEYDVDAFNVPLSRVSPVDIADFDPYRYI